MSAVQTLTPEQRKTQPVAKRYVHFSKGGPLSATAYEFRRYEGVTDLAQEPTYSAVVVLWSHISNAYLDRYPGLKPSESEGYEYRVKVPAATKSQLDKWIRKVVLESLTPENKSWIPVSGSISVTTQDLEAKGYKVVDQYLVDVRWPNKVAG